MRAVCLPRSGSGTMISGGRFGILRSPVEIGIQGRLGFRGSSIAAEGEAVGSSFETHPGEPLVRISSGPEPPGSDSPYTGSDTDRCCL